MTIGQLFTTLALGIALSSFGATPPPAPKPPVPSEAQMARADMDQYAFIHFGLNAFTHRQWGFGDEDPKRFDPSKFDADQIVGALKSAGLKGVILTAKHHDGFCLWPTKTTPHSIAASPYRGGKGDIVRELSEAAKRAGLKFGIYISPWDRNNAEYGTPAYREIYHAQWHEALTQYGPLFEVWSDGANGGDGWYGGKKERRSIDASTYYDYPRLIAEVRRLQPHALMFSDAGPDLRWVGNEQGHAGDPCRATVNPEGWYPGKADKTQLRHGLKDGPAYIPAEVDVSIRPGWFWDPAEDARVKTPRRLLDIYFDSVGRNAFLILNVAPDSTGLVPDTEVNHLREYGRLLKEIFVDNRAAGASAVASETRGGDDTYSPAKLLDGDNATYWSTNDDTRSASVTLTLPEAREFNVVRLREPLRLGERVEDWKIETFESGTWKPYASGKVVGNTRLVRGRTVRTDRVRLTLSGGSVCPALSDFGLFYERKAASTPRATRDLRGDVTLAAATGETIRYTTDGKAPTEKSATYTTPVPFPRGGLLKARAFSKEGPGEIAQYAYGLAQSGWKTAGETAGRAIDNDPSTAWTAPVGSSFIIDLGETTRIRSFLLTPRTGTDAGVVDRARFDVSPDGTTWTVAAEEELSNIRAERTQRTLRSTCDNAVRFVRFTALRTLEGETASVPEVGVVATP